ncbi:NAD(P)H-dependent glycerol-3-phosphate dehydrogenase [Methyloversatilis sp. XJ19-49]|uniref:NAD(P)H-dependent glycerol-3-phosphate dehydrogenase n=1 Tax=Methyloversatilis sp. XJ19-49 TaxID=2963429 RepID=UPI00211C1884|nr:NAD(P)H-dependent glycerol-3-phosphate dehydrogenase [Methyloversatilis sp. XJ19-49]MCQ9379606.1 NAD(P)-dependent glycerol-3-phosphate dehydrogenase [Methyloversatilis sp. XJ19-49]
MKLCIMGAGAWGTALAVAYSQDHDVTLWTRDAAHALSLRNTHCNERYLPGIALPPGVAVSSDAAHALDGSDLALIATPIAGLRAALEAVARSGVSAVLWACKGFESGSGLLPHQVAVDILPAQVSRGAFSGPSFAIEVARGLPTAITVASDDIEFVSALVASLHSPRLRLYANDDLIGVEVGGAVKNVMAIATGVCDGLGFGLNARAALITRGLAEIARLGVALGGRSQTFMGLAGMGDLILTCTGDLSRNRRVGLLLAEGRSLDEVLNTLGHVAEGVPTAREAAALAVRLQVDMPITQAVTAVLDGRLAAAEAVERLLSRDPKAETPPL